MKDVPVVIVTGAGSGIGQATACRLAREGYAVALAGRRRNALRQTAERIAADPAQPPDPFVWPTDVADESACAQLIDAVGQRFCRLDALINVAGFAELTDLAQASTATWRQTFAVNVDAVFFLTRAAWPLLIGAERSIVVNVSSQASIDPFAGLGLYAAAKAAVNLLTLTTAREGQCHGLHAVAIAPGAVETPLLRSLFDTRTLPPDQVLPAESVAALIADCVTARRAFQPGQVISIKAGEPIS